jgi:hypothetical protein
LKEGVSVNRKMSARDQEVGVERKEEKTHKDHKHISIRSPT